VSKWMLISVKKGWDEPDTMVDEDDLPVLDSWTERTADDLWVLGDEVEISTPIDIEFALWYKGSFNDDQGKITETYSGWTDGSRRQSAAFGWTLREATRDGKQTEINSNKGCRGEFETAFDGEVGQLLTFWNTYKSDSWGYHDKLRCSGSYCTSETLRDRP
jgi:hypothetical protein